MTATTLAPALLLGGTGAALGAAAAVVVPTSAEAAESASAERGHHRFTTRVQVAPGVHVAVADLDGGRKGTVVLVPGWPLSSIMLENTTLFLADRGYRAVALDLRGFGESDAPYGPYGYDVWCSDIRTVLKTMGLRDVTLVGHSMGGAVALRYAARFRSRVSRLVVAEPAAPRFVFGAEVRRPGRRARRADRGLRDRPLAGRPRADQDLLLHPHRRHDRPVPAVLRAAGPRRCLAGRPAGPGCTRSATPT